MELKIVNSGFGHIVSAVHKQLFGLMHYEIVDNIDNNILESPIEDG